tara:strand:+ start:955 stop:1218 length:264 start_codon:yes stop_codon:yes gene_type:complete
MIVITDTNTPIVMGTPREILTFTYMGLAAAFDGRMGQCQWNGKAHPFGKLAKASDLGWPILGGLYDAIQEAQIEDVFLQLAIKEPTQ